MTNEVKTYNWKKTAEKFGWALAEILVAGSLAYLTDLNAWLFLVPVLEALKNWLKHRN